MAVSFVRRFTTHRLFADWSVRDSLTLSELRFVKYEYDRASTRCDGRVHDDQVWGVVGETAANHRHCSD